MSGGVLVRMVFVQVVFVRGGFCPYTPCTILLLGQDITLLVYTFLE